MEKEYKDINELLQDSEIMAEEKILKLKKKIISVPKWKGENGLERHYDPKKHPVMDKAVYPDVVVDGKREKVTRVAIGLQKLAVKRMTELVCGIPIQRISKPRNKKQEEVAVFIDKVLKKNRINSVDIKRCRRLFASCEVMTLWYAVEHRNKLYGVDSPLKIRCRNYSPMDGDELYPLFDDTGDLVAISVAYSRRDEYKNTEFFDTYTDSRYIKYVKRDGGDWEEEVNEKTTLGKIPAVYVYRPEPIYEDTSHNIYEMEWSLSRNGNYLRENSRPIFGVFADEAIRYGDEKSPNEASKSVVQFPKGSTANYITWQQAIESLKYQISTLRSLFFTELQLPDWSYEKMSQLALSGESRKQMFIDAQLKVVDESGDLLDFLDREVNVVKSFAKVIFGPSYEADIDELEVEVIVTPYKIEDDDEKAKGLMLANGGEPLMSQRESIVLYGRSTDVEQTLAEIQEQKAVNVLQGEAGF